MFPSTPSCTPACPIVLTLALVLAWPLTLVTAQSCPLDWKPQLGANFAVWGMTDFDDGQGGGPALYIAGDFTDVGGRVARWDGASWSGLAGGVAGGALPDAFGDVLITFDDGQGGGPALYFGGSFSTAGGVSAKNIARWDGSSWSALGAGLGAYMLEFAVFDDGGGPALYAGGTFTTAGGASANHIARWDGTSWSSLAGGVSGWVEALAVFDDGSGPALFVGGSFLSADGTPANSIARWDGTSWSALGSGLNNAVSTLCVFDDGGGPSLYAGGTFTTAGGAATNHIARWDGTSWSPLGSGIDGQVITLTVHDDGNGPALYAGGAFTEAGGVQATDVARWDGQAWSFLDSGVGGGGAFWLQSVLTLFSHAGDLWVGGAFFEAGDEPASCVARWGCVASEPVWTFRGSGLAGEDGIPSLAGNGSLLAASSGSLEMSHAAESAPALLVVGLLEMPTPFKGGTLLPVPILLPLLLQTTGTGALSVPFTWPAGVPSGFELLYQIAVQDAAAPQGVALSNGLKSASP